MYLWYTSVVTSLIVSDSYSLILVLELSRPASTVSAKLDEASALTLTAFTGKDAPNFMDVVTVLDMLAVCLLNSSNSSLRVVRVCSLTLVLDPHSSFDPGVRRAITSRWTVASMMTFWYFQPSSPPCR